jgi:hypothetical protein
MPAVPGAQGVQVSLAGSDVLPGAHLAGCAHAPAHAHEAAQGAQVVLLSCSAW